MKKIIFSFPSELNMDLNSLASVLRTLCFEVTLVGRTMTIEPTDESTPLEEYFTQEEIRKHEIRGIRVSVCS